MRWLRVRFTEWLRAAGASADLVDDLSLAAYEALANVVEHAYPFGHPDPTMRLRARFGLHQVLVTISDRGCWRTSPASTSRGRGLIMMHCLATDVQVYLTDQGTTVRLRVALPYSEDGWIPPEPAIAP